MSNKKISSITGSAIKILIVQFFKLVFIAFGWALKVISTILAQIGETIHKIIIKKSSL